VVSAAKAAHEIGMTAWALTGPAPNTLAAVCDDAIAVEAPSMATVQEVHLAVIHALCAVVDDALGVVAPTAPL
jgi:D-sedoheptulose 7-phosphate isomerase